MMQAKDVVFTAELFSVILIIALFTARIVQLRCELKEFQGWSWRRPGDNKKRALMFLFWPVGVAACAGALCGLFNAVYGISLSARFHNIVYFVAPYDLLMTIPAGASLYGLIEHIVVRKKLGDRALDLLFWAGVPPVRTGASLMDDFKDFPVTERYIERVRGMDLLQKTCIVLAIGACVVSLIFIPKDMHYLYLVTDTQLIYSNGGGTIERIYELDQLYRIDYSEREETWTLYFSDGEDWSISHEGIVGAVKQTTGIEQTAPSASLTGATPAVTDNIL